MADQTPPADPIPCPPCRGTGSVISNLGGTPATVQCPWCEGSGVFWPDHHDAQAARRDAGAVATE